MASSIVRRRLWRYWPFCKVRCLLSTPAANIRASVRERACGAAAAALEATEEGWGGELLTTGHLHVLCRLTRNNHSFSPFPHSVRVSSPPNSPRGSGVLFAEGDQAAKKSVRVERRKKTTGRKKWREKGSRWRTIIRWIHTLRRPSGLLLPVNRKPITSTGQRRDADVVSYYCWLLLRLPARNWYWRSSDRAEMRKLRRKDSCFVWFLVFAYWYLFQRTGRICFFLYYDADI